MVDVIMATYNHEKYISQAIESVLMQECDYDYRLIIGEDCSPDGTLAICEKYAEAHPDRIKLIKHETNTGLGNNYKTLFNAVTAKYVAILESDDYWVDKHKLQKQVDILESHPEVGLVHGNFYSLYENGQKKKGHVWANTDSLNGQVVGPTQHVPININPLTTCFRADFVKEHVDFDFIIENRLLTVDLFLWAEICRRSSVLYMDEILGIYRIHRESITGNPDISAIETFSNTSLMMVNYLMDKYDTPQAVKTAYNSRNRLRLINEYLLAGEPRKAKQELKHVKVIGSFKNKIIYFSAKYRVLNFLAPLMDRFFALGSNIKQSIERMQRGKKDKV
jgi:glucosyltransferase